MYTPLSLENELVPPTGSPFLEVTAFAVKLESSNHRMPHEHLSSLCHLRPLQLHLRAHILFSNFSMYHFVLGSRFSLIVTRASSNFSGFAGLCITMVDGYKR